MIYVALLRGINVGGNSRVEMVRLRAVFESLGCSDVASYINSGNIIFQDERKDQALIPLIEAAIETEFGFNVRVILRDLARINQLCTEIPQEWVNDTQQRTDVLFLWDEIADKKILAELAIRPEIENVIYSNGAIVWNISRQNVTRSGQLKLIGTPYYKQMTIRNINTVRKLQTLMSAVDNVAGSNSD